MIIRIGYFSKFTLGGRVSSITYPTGRTVDYARNAYACSVDGIYTIFNGTTRTLMENLAYRPFGGAVGMDTGADDSVSSVFDEAGRLATLNPGATHERTYTHDNNGNLTSITAPASPWVERVYEYDQMERLVHAEGYWGVTDYEYDGVGNRLLKTENDVPENYAYFSETNRIEEVATDSGSVVYQYDANGNVIGIGDKTLTYNQNNRLVMVEENGSVLGEYTYNGLGQRIVKEAGGVTTIFHYDFDGNIIGESILDGTFDREYLYHGQSRLAMVDVGTDELYAYGNDSLGTPEILINSNNEAVWEAKYRPFGEVEVNPNSTVVNNFRFPGQYYDEETGFHYNYHRYYDPSTGRYLRPDPIGQEGGINIFLYAHNNPVNEIDPEGLQSSTIAKYYAKFEGALKPYLIGGALILTGATTTAAGAVTTVVGYGSMPATGPAGALIGTTGLVVTAAGIGQVTLGLDVYADEIRHRLGLPEWFDIISHFELIKHEHLTEGECE